MKVRNERDWELGCMMLGGGGVNLGGTYSWEGKGCLDTLRVPKRGLRRPGGGFEEEDAA